MIEDLMFQVKTPLGFEVSVSRSRRENRYGKNKDIL